MTTVGQEATVGDLDDNAVRAPVAMMVVVSSQPFTGMLPRGKDRYEGILWLQYDIRDTHPPLSRISITRIPGCPV